MKTDGKLAGYLHHLKARLYRSRLDKVERVRPGDELPLRAELFSSAQMEQHAQSLATRHRLAQRQAPDHLLARLDANEKALVGVRTLLAGSIDDKHQVTPAGEWLLDNFYLVEEHIRAARRHLPAGYSRELPRLEPSTIVANSLATTVTTAAGRSDVLGRSSGHPRVYDIALEIIAHDDGRVDLDVISRFISAYQSITPLKLGELWAMPIMFRLAVIENIRRVARRIEVAAAARNLADLWADRMTETALSDPKSLIMVIADMARSDPPLDSAFVADLVRRLQGRGPSLLLALGWVEERLAEAGLSIEQLVQTESQLQAANQVSISNSIGGLRALTAIDWHEFVESMSLVEQTLLQDPGGVYGRMDFATRDQYRHAVEAIARGGRLNEPEVATQALQLARAGAERYPACRAETINRVRHVGHYLVGKGRPELERAAGARVPIGEVIRRQMARVPLLWYLGPIELLTALIAWSLFAEVSLRRVEFDGPLMWAMLASMAVVAVIGASQLSVALVNWLTTLLVTPRALPRMDFSKGIPTEARTLVVVPSLLSSAAHVEQLVEALEVRFLANRDPCLHFGLLTDFLDADSETLPADAALTTLARNRIEALNAKYGSGVEGQRWEEIFFLFHRPRRWNAREGKWMGHERKRGKLAALNALLRGTGEEFSLIVGETTVLANVKYVITLDTDTQLPRDAARQFVGAMAHPLNVPVYDVERQRVVDGYGILQPRVAITLPGSNRANRTRYAQIYGGEPGIDPYTRTVSDVYQDVFDEGSFIGKGIYDVDAFETALSGCFPDNLILSHDLLEGCYARSGLLSDVNLFEDYPAHYFADVSRRHRWIRGDWQITGWLGLSVPLPGNGGRQQQKNPLTTLSQWKIFDNLRRSLVPASMVLLFVWGWLFLAHATYVTGLWTLSVLGILLIPTLCALLLDVVRKPDEILLRQHLGALGHGLARRLQQVLFELACLPYEAWYSVDAIGRTLWRVYVSRRRLLEWAPSEADLGAGQKLLSRVSDGVRAGNGDEAGEDQNGASPKARRATPAANASLAVAWRKMWIAPALSLVVAIVLMFDAPPVLTVAAPVLLLWFFSPTLAWWYSQPLAVRRTELSPVQLRFLRQLARRTWAFFDTVVGAEDNWLPPDNYQEYRVVSVAHRSSPTNFGLALLANLSAYDFGYIQAGTLLERTRNTLTTLSRLERYRGHFYNWYDTQTLEPLPPLYVSTVDSGNLAGHLLTLRSGLLALADAPLLSPRSFEGIEDTLGVLEATLEEQGGKAVPGLAALQAHVASLCRARATVDMGVDADADASSVSGTAAEHVTELRDSLLLLVDLAEGLQANVALTELMPPATGKVDGAGVWAAALYRQCGEALAELDLWLPAAAAAVGDRMPSLRQLAAAGDARARRRMVELEQLARQAEAFADIDYDFLFDASRDLLTIGYNVSEHRIDAGYYDLLASEARLASFVAIAQGKLPQDNWFALGRLLAGRFGATGAPALQSWSGSMFEYLMPLLVMPTFDNTLLDETYKAAVASQIKYGNQRRVPWGISESGYNTVDVHLNYQYRAFGVPGLGIRRGLAEDLVIAPYATALALMVAPEAACENLQRLDGEGFMGRFGLYEAIDYTPARQRRDQTHVVVRSFMAHHQGMSLLSLAYLLLDRPMQKRFAADPQFRAVMPLLHERIPRATAIDTQSARFSEIRSTTAAASVPLRIFSTPDTPTPEVQLLSNGRYHVMVTSAGGGYSRWNQLAVTRWREDATCDNWGSFCYIREINKLGGATGEFWSNAWQPSGKQPQAYEAIFSEGRAEFRRRDAVHGAEAGGQRGRPSQFETHTEIVVSPEDDIELRRVRITNRSPQTREIEVTSYAEVVIAPHAADVLHPAFSNLFVQTEILREKGAILCTRRPRTLGERMPWMLHLMAVHGGSVLAVSYETDRARFIGRLRSVDAPLAMASTAALSDSEGSVLDPVVAIRYRVRIDAEQSVSFDLVSGVGESREVADSLIDKYRDRRLADRVFDLAWTHSQVVLLQIDAQEAEAQLYARLAAAIVFADGGLRADPSVLIANRRGQSGLWGYSISGDLPIVLLQIGDAANFDLVRQLVQAHAYWRLKGLTVDLVIWNEDRAGYRQQLQDQIIGLIASGLEASLIDRPGGIFVRQSEQIPNEDRTLFLAVARAVLSDAHPTLEAQFEHRRLAAALPPMLQPQRAPRIDNVRAFAVPRTDLQHFNGIGGFAADGREYVITLEPGQTTPAPWVNVIANPGFGTVVSESGGAYSWSENAHEFRLSPWHNDPVGDASGEAIYLRDEESGHFWSPTPMPARAATTYGIRHGFGYSVFEAKTDGLRSELWVYVATDAAVKFSVLKISNESGRRRRLSATGYVEWVLGDVAAKSAMHVSTELDAASGAILARNPYSPEFSDRVVFFDGEIVGEGEGTTDATPAARNVCGDRAEFIGRNGSLRAPAALRRTRLSGRLGAGLDPCAAIQLPFDLADGQTRTVIFRLGAGRNDADAVALATGSRGEQAARAALDGARTYWDETLGAVHIETPDAAVNVLANGWLLYQTLACRIFARSGFYQSGGAFGFRDQLQDMMALVHCRPELLREHLLLSASRQFLEGDVQHWWHPPAGRGVRTRISDDYLWLPLATCRYVVCSGDAGVLDATTHFLEGRPLPAGEESYYDLPSISPQSATLYEHCVRAIRHGLNFGAHGLPLIGAGDWNDGMNRVGIEGRGESVWLGFFLCEVLRQFEPVAAAYGDVEFADSCRRERVKLNRNLEKHAWDGQWYRRGWFDDGTPLGSAESAECRIDSISQSWAVLSGAGDPARTRTAMDAVDQHLVRREHGLIQLLDPPFDSAQLDPGYIRGYVPGVRENGGQYTHAAIWTTMAFAALGDRERAWELLGLINPVHHGAAEHIGVYKVEPYVAVADIYARSPHTGRGGWSWYTGSAGWLYRLIMESLLGLRLEGERLYLTPCVPASWKQFGINYRHRNTRYLIAFSQGLGSPGTTSSLSAPTGRVVLVKVDGVEQAEHCIPLVDDGGEHLVTVLLSG